MAPREPPSDHAAIPTSPTSGRGTGWGIAAGAGVALLGSAITSRLTYEFFDVYGLQTPPPEAYRPASLLGLLHLALAAGCLIGGRLMARRRRGFGLGLMIGWLVGFLMLVGFLLAIQLILMTLDFG